MLRPDELRSLGFVFGYVAFMIGISQNIYGALYICMLAPFVLRACGGQGEGGPTSRINL